MVSSVGLVHKLGHLLGRWEGLVDELEVVVVESLVVFEMVFLALEELVDLGEPRAVEGFSLLKRIIKWSVLTGCGP